MRKRNPIPTPTPRVVAGAATACLALLLVAASSAAPAATPTLKLTPTVVDYGGTSVLLSGVVASKRSGQTVSVLSRACRFTEFAEIATVKTKAGGAFSFRLQPMLNTTFRVRASSSLSPAVGVRVRPLLKVRRVAAGVYRIELSTTNPVFLNGKVVELQRLTGTRWVTVKRAPLEKASPETDITVISAVTIRAKLTGRLRASLPTAQASCYVGVASRPIWA